MVGASQPPLRPPCFQTLHQPNGPRGRCWSVLRLRSVPTKRDQGTVGQNLLCNLLVFRLASTKRAERALLVGALFAVCPNQSGREGTVGQDLLPYLPLCYCNAVCHPISGVDMCVLTCFAGDCFPHPSGPCGAVGRDLLLPILMQGTCKHPTFRSRHVCVHCFAGDCSPQTLPNQAGQVALLVRSPQRKVFPTKRAKWHCWSGLASS